MRRLSVKKSEQKVRWFHSESFFRAFFTFFLAWGDFAD